jgi:hypothetical protein
MAKTKQLEPDKNAQTPEQLERVAQVDEWCTQGNHPEEDLKSYTQLAYFLGHQWIAVNHTNKTIVPLPKDDWQVQYTANRILPAVRNELSKVTRHKLTKGVVPASTEEEDIRAARLADKVVEWLEYDKKLQEIDEEAILWALTTRIGFVKVVWNPSKGMTLATEDGKPAVRQGDVDIEPVNLFELKWDSAASNWRDIRWVVHEKVRSVEYIKQVYGKDVPEEDGLSMTNIYDNKLRALSTGSSWFGSEPVKAKGCATVKEAWVTPCSKYPNGRRITTANGIELFHDEDIGFGPEDTSERQIPIFPLIHIQVPGRIIGTSMTEQLMPVQREYNKSRSQIIENKNLMANPKWVVEVGSLLDDDIDTAPGSVVYYKKGFNPPKMSQPTSLGSDVDKNIERCIEEFMHISSQMEVSHGSTPSGVSSGVAISLLQEQDDTKLAPTVAHYGRWKQNYLSYMLKVLKYNYTEERTVQLVGKNKRMEAVVFRGSDLTSTDVRFEDMSLTQMSAAARKQYVIELISYGVLNPQMDRDLIIRMLELGISDELYDAAEIDVQQALNENAAWAKQDFSPITRDFFNHEVHILQHNKFRKGDEYEMLPPEIQAVVDAHVDEHHQYILMAMQEQAMAQAPPQEQAGGDTVDTDKVMASLTPEEQAFVQQNPAILDTL